MDQKRDTVSRRKAICSNCRRRKSKCDSRQPRCSTCITHNSQCHYDKPPSLAYVRSLEAKIENLLLERNGTTIPGQKTGVGTPSQVVAKNTDHAGRAATSPYEAHSLENISELSIPSDQNIQTPRESERDCNRWVSQISVDSRGSVSFHNPTSVFHEAPSPDDRLNTMDRISSEVLSKAGNSSAQQASQIKHSLVSNAANQKRLEALAIGNIAAVQNDVPGDVVTATEFLRFHWCWIHPMFMFVYRPAFTRDMALSSPNQPETPYFSETLLKVLLAHSARFRVQDPQHRDAANAVMNKLSQQAQFSLAMRITGSSSIPTVQALLQQSAREVAFGNSSQAWLYSGMAFRIAIDLGIHLPSDKLRGYVRNLTAEDIEIRKRLFWGCYTWDKAISLYLGRMPAFIPSVESNAPVFMDDFTENDLWEPFYGYEDAPHDTSRPIYPPQKGYMISCFTGLCKVSTILSTIMLEIYGSSPEARVGGETSSTDSHADTGAQNSKNSAFIRISSSIHKWWIDLPDIVRLDVKNLPAISPPLHIVSLNLLYHTTLILLHRPFIIGATAFESPAVLRSYQICIEAAASIHDLLVLLTSTFGYGHTTYLNCYNTYIAATIAVLHFQLQEEAVMLPESDIHPGKLGLKFFLGVLQKSATAMPGLSRSVEIVKRHMQTTLDRRSKKYLDSLFPVSDPNCMTAEQPFSTETPISMQQSNQFTPLGAHSAHQQTDGGYSMFPGFNLEGLPAFPGQNFSIGLDCSLDQEIIDPELRATFLGLDPHLTLHHENSDWTYGGFYV